MAAMLESWDCPSTAIMVKPLPDATSEGRHGVVGR